MSRTPSMNFVYSLADPRGGIYPSEIERLKKRIQIGDRIRVNTTKGHVNLTPDPGNTKPGTISRRGTVISKHRYLVTLEYPGGLTESFRWAELVAM